MASLMRRDRGGRGELQRGRGGLFDPFEMMKSLMDLDPFEPLGGAVRSMQEFLVPFDVKETKDAWIFQADLPGVKEEDVDVSVTGNVLTVSGRREHEQAREGETWHAYERGFGSFSRSFTLPENADPDGVQAELSAGELKLVVPKRPEMQPKKIPIAGRKANGSGRKDVEH